LTIHPCIREADNSVIITLKIRPSYPKAKILITDYSIELHVKEPPVKNKANQAILKFLSKVLEIPSNSIQLVQGQKSRTKIVAVEGLLPQQVYEKLISFSD